MKCRKLLIPISALRNYWNEKHSSLNLATVKSRRWTFWDNIGFGVRVKMSLSPSLVALSTICALARRLITWYDFNYIYRVYITAECQASILIGGLTKVNKMPTISFAIVWLHTSLAPDVSPSWRFVVRPIRKVAYFCNTKLTYRVETALAVDFPMDVFFFLAWFNHLQLQNVDKLLSLCACWKDLMTRRLLSSRVRKIREARKVARLIASIRVDSICSVYSEVGNRRMVRRGFQINGRRASKCRNRSSILAMILPLAEFTQ